MVSPTPSVSGPDRSEAAQEATRQWLDVACDVLAGLMILAALYTAVHATSGLRWPYDPDHFRDIAFAQTARDGHPLSDASYAGEWIWYNPLVPWLVALGSAATRTVPTLFHVRGGPFLNLLGPVAFYALGVRLAGRPGALAALALSLFFLCSEDCWACATYSPWLFTSTFTQGLFYVSVLALLAASRQQSLRSSAIAGVLVGLTFLSHTAPALILAVLGVALLRPRPLVVCGVVAAVVASPFLVAIVGHYHLRVLNTLPLTWQYGPLAWPALLGTLRANVGWFLGAGVGLVWLHTRAVVAWIGAAILLLGAGYVATPVVPAFHFWIYLMAAAALLTGVAVARLLRWPALTVAVTCAAVLWHWPAYAARQDFQLVRGIAEGRDPNHAAMAEALRRLSRPGEVVLGTHGAANLIIGPAGRHVVAPLPAMANPYVPLDARLAARDEMLKAVQTHDLATFRPLAERYDVALVVSVGNAECAAALTFEPLVAVERLGDVCLARVRFIP